MSSLRFFRPFSRWTWVSPYQNVSTLDFIGAKGDGGNNWSYKMCKAPVKMSPPTNQHPVFYRLDCSSCLATVPRHWREMFGQIWAFKLDVKRYHQSLKSARRMSKEACLRRSQSDVVDKFRILFQLREELLLLLQYKRSLECLHHQPPRLRTHRVTGAGAGVPQHRVLRLDGAKPHQLQTTWRQSISSHSWYLYGDIYSSGY